tara:strand:+ start:190 stop:345 length:156 start_codon:yes stop_codon:yes gene_type:complete
MIAKELIVTMNFRCLGDKEITQEALEKIYLYYICEKIDIVGGLEMSIKKES